MIDMKALVLVLLVLLVSCDRQSNNGESSVGKSSSPTYDQVLLAIVDDDRDRVLSYLVNGFPVLSEVEGQIEAIYCVIVENRSEIFQLFIDHGLDVNQEWGLGRGNLLTNATQFGHIEIVRVLLSNGVVVNRDPKYGRSALYSSIIYDHAKIEALLLENGAALNSWDEEALRGKVRASDD